MFNKFIEKFNLNEPSTYASFAVALTTFGVAVPEPIIAGVSFILSGAFSLAGWVKKEKKK